MMRSALSQLRICRPHRPPPPSFLHILSWEIPYASYSFEIGRNIIVATFFFMIISQTEYRLAYNQKEIIRNRHIPFNLKMNNKYILLSVC